MNRLRCFAVLAWCLTLVPAYSSAVGEEPIATAQSPDWLQWRGPARDGLLSGARWPEQLGDKLQLKWEQALAPSYSGPLVDDKQVVTTETIDKKLERVSAYDVSTGAERWSVKWEGAISVPFFAASNGDWIRSTPVSNGNRIVIAGMRDVVVCLDSATGEELWRVDLPQTQQTPVQPFGCVCSPLIDGDFVYLQSGGGLVKMQLATGEVVWRTLDSGKDMMTTGAFSSPIVATIAGQRQLVVAARDRLLGIDLESGKTLWEEMIESFRGMNILTPVMVGEHVFSSAHSGRSRLFSIAKSADNQFGVEPLWDNKAQAYMSTPIVIDGHLYMHLKNERFACIDLKTGEEKWTSKTFGKYWSMIGNVDQRRILALDSDGTLRLIAANPSELQVIDEIKVADDSWAHLAIRGSTVVIRALDSLRVFDWQ